MTVSLFAFYNILLCIVFSFSHVLFEVFSGKKRFYFCTVKFYFFSVLVSDFYKNSSVRIIIIPFSVLISNNIFSFFFYFSVMKIINMLAVRLSFHIISFELQLIVIHKIGFPWSVLLIVLVFS